MRSKSNDLCYVTFPPRNCSSVQIHPNSECFPTDITHGSMSPGNSSIYEPQVILVSSILLQQAGRCAYKNGFWKLHFQFSTQGGCRKLVFGCNWHPPIPVFYCFSSAPAVTHLGLAYIRPPDADVSLTFQLHLHSFTHAVALFFVLVNVLISISLCSVCFCTPCFLFQWAER